ncbi:YcxB family protein [Natranaerobius trueperi]|uniref:YcxB-like C-terminal domain-containing protein n=1 Tax=Natranaerobius trueperi TaxID=759412 RepID=A0A226BYR2_9FIRM|nr:YcxB family protein [Natranaerobius trueperi]OWZ84065.1 hypothetical protein CDO51_04940 [Natranaerobius trueperi]
MKDNIKSVFSKSDYIEGYQELVIDDDGIKKSSSYGESLYRWNFMDRVKELDKIIYVQLKNNQYLVIPKRVFDTNEELQNTKKFILDKGLQSEPNTKIKNIFKPKELLKLLILIFGLFILTYIFYAFFILVLMLWKM